MKFFWGGNQFISAVTRLVQGNVRSALPENNNTEKKNKQTRWSNDKTIIELGYRSLRLKKKNNSPQSLMRSSAASRATGTQ